MTTKDLPNTAGAIWNRVMKSMDDSLTLSAARGLLLLEFTEEDRARMHELAAKAREGTLTPAEQVEIREYERASDLLGLIQSRARIRIKRGSRTNGTSH